MRYHEPWTIFPRKMPSGLTIFYYRTRDEAGRRTCAWSTGKTTKSEARDHCRKLEKDGKLIPSKEKAPNPLLFFDLARGFWDWDTSEYIKTRLQFSDPKRPAMARRYADDMERIVRLHLIPTFGRRRLDSITPQEIESFALRLRDDGLAGKTANNVVVCFRVMLAEAYRAGIIGWDPKKSGIIRRVGTAPKERGRLTREEVQRLFADENLATAWKGHALYRAINFVAAATGMRQGEILAVRDEDLQEDFIHVRHSYADGYGLGPTKTKQSRGCLCPRASFKRSAHSSEAAATCSH